MAIIRQERVKNYIQKIIKITSQRELQYFQNVLFDQLSHKFVGKNPELAQSFYKKEITSFAGIESENIDVPKNIQELDDPQLKLFFNFVRKMPQTEMFSLFHSNNIFFYTNVFVNTKYEEDRFICTLEQEFIKSQLIFFNKIFGNLNAEQKEEFQL